MLSALLCALAAVTGSARAPLTRPGTPKTVLGNGFQLPEVNLAQTNVYNSAEQHPDAQSWTRHVAQKVQYRALSRTSDLHRSSDNVPE